MRVTQNMMTETMLRNLNQNMSRLQDAQNQLSSDQRISRPSQDPAGASAVLQFDSARSQIEQFLKNIDHARGWLDTTDQALQTISDAVTRVRELALSALNGTLSDSDRNAINQELGGLLDTVVATGNTTLAEQYIFAGQKTHTQPFDGGTTPPTYQGDSGAIAREIDAGATVTVTVTGDTAIQPVLVALSHIRAAVEANDATALRAGIDALDTAEDTLVSAQATVGANSNRIDAQRDRLTRLQSTIAAERSSVQDVDMAQAIIEFSTAQTVYNASLQAGARAIQPSLIDYLR